MSEKNGNRKKPQLVNIRKLEDRKLLELIFIELKKVHEHLDWMMKGIEEKT